MGQYYKPTILGDNKKTIKSFMYSHDYDNGLKLMEHSYIGNNFVGAFETLLIKTPQRVVWAGDYAENCKNRKSNIYGRCKDKVKVNPVVKEDLPNFIINHSKKEFVDKNKVPTMSAEWTGGDMKIHPLPLLTCEGNGQGGGDFFGDGKGIVGTWARDIISIDYEVPSDFKQIVFDLDE